MPGEPVAWGSFTVQGGNSPRRCAQPPTMQRLSGLFPPNLLSRGLAVVPPTIVVFGRQETFKSSESLGLSNSSAGLFPFSQDVPSNTLISLALVGVLVRREWAWPGLSEGFRKRGRLPWAGAVLGRGARAARIARR